MRKKQPASKRSTGLKLSVKSNDLPATYGALNKTRNELKSDIAALRSEMKGEFNAP